MYCLQIYVGEINSNKKKFENIKIVGALRALEKKLFLSLFLNLL
jgi:hypothetical protein